MIEQTLDIATKDGAMETFVVRPERGGPCPPVLFLMDAPGIREELRDMARRLLVRTARMRVCSALPCSSTAAPSTRACARCGPR